MRLSKIEFSSQLLKAIRDKNLVIFAGAGVSMGEPANLPSFDKLTRDIAAGTGEVKDEGEPADRFLGKLHHKGVEVHELADAQLNREGLQSNKIHIDLIRLFSTVEEIKIITTNFDLLFEHAAKSVFPEPTEKYIAPALPLGSKFSGIVHVHGALTNPREMILTDADFGRAYLVEGWARRFLLDVFTNYNVLFVGYSHDDVVMHYISRALPTNKEKMRFALVGQDDDTNKWKMLGIEPVVFPKESLSDFSALNEGLKRLADISSKGLLDWRRELTEIAKMPPPADPEIIGVLEVGLEEVTTSRFFVEAAENPLWLDWLDDRKYLRNLFENNKLTEKDFLFAGWIGKHHALSNFEHVWKLIAKNGMKLNDDFWGIIVSEIAFNDDIVVEKEVLQKWVEILLESSPKKLGRRQLYLLTKKCIALDDDESLLRLFHYMTQSNLVLKTKVQYTDAKIEGELALDTDFEVSLVGDHYELNEMWKDGICKKIEQHCAKLVSLTISRLDELFSIQKSVGKASADWDPISYRRAGIESNAQDKYPTTFDVLIDAARDSMECLARTNTSLMSYWSEIISKSEAPLLRRLATHLLPLRNELNNEDKLRWLIDNIGLYDRECHHELYRVVHELYPLVDDATRELIVKEVVSYEWPDKEDAESAIKTDSLHFEWLSWLSDAHPGCSYAKNALDEVKSRNPKFRSREHPDYKQWIGEIQTGPESPWTSEQLLSKPPRDWLTEINAFESDDFLGPDRHGLMQSISEASKKNFQWSLAMASELVRKNEHTNDVWNGVIGAWSDQELDEDQFEEIFKYFNIVEIRNTHPYVISRVLLNIFRNPDKAIPPELIVKINRMGMDIWKDLDKNASPPDSDWLGQAINHSGGVLAQLLLNGLSKWVEHQETPPTSLPDEYIKPLEEMLSDKSVVGGFARTVIASQLAFLLTIDEEWATKQIVPLFKAGETLDFFVQAWSGFLIWGRINLQVVDVMGTLFLDALKPINEHLGQHENRLVEFIATISAFYVDDPIEAWIPNLFDTLTTDQKGVFASQIAYVLRGLNEEQQKSIWENWLQSYWRNRNMGVPCQLESVEIENMLEWTTLLPAVFEEAVEAACNMPKKSLDSTAILFSLKDSPLVLEHPESIAKLIIYLIDSDSAGAARIGLRHIAPQLKGLALEPELKEQLEEKLASVGLADLISQTESEEDDNNS